MPDVQGKLDEIITMVETAKGKALSGNAAIIDRPEMLAALEDLRHLLPQEMSDARAVLRRREDLEQQARQQSDELLQQARAEADRLVAAAREERARLVSENAVVAEAERVAGEITEEAEAEAVRMREQTDDYIDASLARIEQLLTSSLETVTRGRARVAAARAQVAAAQEYDEPYVDANADPAAGNGYAPIDDPATSGAGL
jgi:cell division septum initiation protein DivIVA